ncbi:hypothetical protein D3C81_2037990 [compost metagenome]
MKSCMQYPCSVVWAVIILIEENSSLLMSKRSLIFAKGPTDCDGSPSADLNFVIILLSDS